MWKKLKIYDEEKHWNEFQSDKSQRRKNTQNKQETEVRRGWREKEGKNQT